jgi:hypothetical protein
MLGLMNHGMRIMRILPEALGRRFMNLNAITEIKRPSSTEEIPRWKDGYAYLAGGTWLFSTPQISTHSLIDFEWVWGIAG